MRAVSSCSTANAAMERARADLDGLGAQAREDRRVQSTPARLARIRAFPSHQVQLARSCPSVRYCLTLDSDTRLPRDASQEARRDHFAPAEPGADRSGFTQSGSRLRHPAASRQRHDGERRRLAVRSHLRRPHGRRSHTRRRFRIFIRICSAKAFSPARVSTTSTPSWRRWRTASPKTRCCRTTCSRGCTRERRSCLDIEVVDDYPSSVPGARAAPAPVGPRRLADPACGCSRSCRRGRGLARNPPAAHLALEDSRQPPTQPRRAHDRSRCSLSAGRPCRAAQLSGRLATLGGADRSRRSLWLVEIVAGPRPWQPWRVLARDLIDDTKTALARGCVQLIVRRLSRPVR